MHRFLFQVGNACQTQDLSLACWSVPAFTLYIRIPLVHNDYIPAPRSLRCFLEPKKRHNNQHNTSQTTRKTNHCRPPPWCTVYSLLYIIKTNHAEVTSLMVLDYYALLGISRSATTREICAGYQWAGKPKEWAAGFGICEGDSSKAEDTSYY